MLQTVKSILKMILIFNNILSLSRVELGWGGMFVVTAWLK